MLPSSPKDAKAIGSKRYFTGVACKRGHVCERYTDNAGCMLCSRELSYRRSLLPHVKSANAINKQKPEYRAQQKEYASRGKKYSAKPQEFFVPLDLPKDERVRIYARQYYHANKHKMKKPNPEKRRVYVNQWAKKNRKTTTGAAISFMRICLSRCLYNKKDRTECILGYTKKELVLFIGAKFQNKMSWENYGEWHIDHIVSIHHFLSVGVTDPKIINALSNLQPLWAVDNLAKGKKHDVLQGF